MPRLFCIKKLFVIVPKHAKSYFVDFGTLRDYTYYVVIKLNITFIKVGEVGTVTVYTMLMLLIGNISTIINDTDVTDRAGACLKSVLRLSVDKMEHLFVITWMSKSI